MAGHEFHFRPYAIGFAWVACMLSVPVTQLWRRTGLLSPGCFRSLCAARACSILAERHMKLLQTSLQKPLTGHFSQVLSHRFLSQVFSQVSSHRVESQVLSHRSSLTGPLSQLNRYRHPYVRDVLHVISHRSSLTGLFHRYSFIGPSLIGLFHRFLSQGISSQVSLTGRVS